ncbi:tripartite tricarboxylate transporter TctB family protein [Falsirhodobacter halotolerans]|uniref:tripartite tricarboxylate transporter TctB family protein n=1 Tax=Falsirhodobacter halotolerans TaxID=1146892 RepID=UPI001FD51746|nr:tripartite tricarboxylate transporter TctB family protein [Falsirhodobacter halotolerans]MCJ8140932.1 tripartite tricarboxylate transporter TctB family protein [Falsirhodobacter halotolerans]
MADRIFAGVMLVVTLAYGWLAFTAISAPFQYDPLGPESWPRILSVVTALCFAIIILRPDTPSMNVARPTWIRLSIMVVLLIAYAELYERLGFIIATFLFGTLAARMLGATWARAALFGAIAGVVGFLLCVELLELNLPRGLLDF